ncbi:MAG: RnfABCDGE type electron transport complex subunit B [Candidatus Omnitrophica bacterium]|nr:RnfABCDGE type electron transport complex subunit B [Candidatus Omnitrophota bacterium]
MMRVLWAAAIVGGLGFLFGIVLAWCSKKLYVAADPRVSRLTDLLPGVNCGACGQPGCANFAEALADGTVQPSGCVVASPAARKKIEAFLRQAAPAACACGTPADGGRDVAGVCTLCTAAEKKDIADALEPESEPVEEAAQEMALIACGGGQRARNTFAYTGVADCRIAAKTLGGQKACGSACLEQGTCIEVCPFQAIRVQPEGLPRVIPELCRGCRKCVAACPRKIIFMVPRAAKIFVRCHSRDKGPVVMKRCAVGCIACGKCVKACVAQAIRLENNLAVIDYTRCTGCGQCVSVCPTKTMSFVELPPAVV